MKKTSSELKSMPDGEGICMSSNETVSHFNKEDFQSNLVPGNQPMSASPELDSKKIFEVLLDALKDAYKELLDLGLKISGVVIIVLGWFASQKNPLAFLCDSRWLAIASLMLVVLGFGLIGFLFRLVASRAQEAFEQLVSRGFDTTLFMRFRVTRSMLIGGIVSQALMLGGICFYIYYRYYLHGGTTCGQK